MTLSEFEKQMHLLAMTMRPVSLRDALHTLRRGQRLDHKSVAVTFDDGYENNVALALPVLRRYGIPATIFLSTRWIDEGTLFPFDKLRLIALWRKRSPGEVGRDPSFPAYGRVPIGEVLRWLSETWPVCDHLLTEAQRSVLRPLSWERIESARSESLDFGAHTRHHAILANETREFRREEILASVEVVRRRTGSRDVIFCYPNGEVRDFDDEDKRTVREAGCIGAVSAIRGSNPPGSDLFALRRYPIGLSHSRQAFLVELSGLKDAVKAIIKR